MKTKLIVLLLALVAPAFAAGDHGHAHGHEKTPAGKLVGSNKGRVLMQLEPHAELFVTAERKVRLTFLGEDGKPVAVPAGLSATLVTGDRSAPVTLGFAPDAGSLLSTAALPEGKNLPAVLRVKPSAEAGVVTVRVPLNLAACGECDRPEYACACGH